MKELNVKASDETLDQVLAFVEENLEPYDCSMKTMMLINLSVEEIFVNIAHYAYQPGEGNATVQLEVEEDTRMASITLVDQGMPYDPLAREMPDVTLSAEERRIGGLGIFLVKKNMDEVTYAYRDGSNVLTMRKKI